MIQKSQSRCGWTADATLQEVGTVNLATTLTAFPQYSLGQDAFAILPLISLSLVPLALSAWVLYRELVRSRDPGLSRRFASAGLVASLALVAGLIHSAVPDWMPNVPAWHGWGLHSSKETWPSRAKPASHIQRAESICRLWNQISESLDRNVIPKFRDDLGGTPPETWVIPGEGGPTWLYVSDGDSFVPVEPYPIDGTQLATSTGVGARPVHKEELQAISQLPGRGL